MKQKDLATIIVIVFVSAVLSLFISKALFGGKHQQLKAEVVQPISSNFTQPDDRYFNKDAFDPTRNITIGQNSNTDPFNGATQQ